MPSATQITKLTATVSAAPLPADFTVHKVAALVRDLAMDMVDIPDTLKKHELSLGQLKTLEGNKFFQEALENAVKDWNAASNTNRRLAMEAAVILEETMPTIGARMRTPTEPLANVVQAASMLAKIAGAEAEKNNAIGTGEKFTITINLGADTERFEKTSIVEIQSLPQGEGTGASPPGDNATPGEPPPLSLLPPGEGSAIQTRPNTETQNNMGEVQPKTEGESP